MKKNLLLLIMAASTATPLFAQSAVDAFRFTRNDMKGTARFMSMGGAFGALGGDLSSLSQNPAGIGVYRTNEVGFTLDLDCQKSTTEAAGNKYSLDNTKFLLNNIGAVFTMRLGSSTFPNFNIGFTYNKGASFNREYAGMMPLSNSMTNYIAGLANSNRLIVNDLASTNNFDPYNPEGGYIPWLPILGYDSYFITPKGPEDNPTWFGQWGEGTSGRGAFHVREKGSVDEYNIALGGNISNVFYWGMNFDIVNFNYTMDAMWGETLDGARVQIDDNEGMQRMTSDWTMDNYYSVSGTGFNYQLGFIVKPIQELRLGFAFHTPTWYKLGQYFGASTDFSYDGGDYYTAKTNNGTLGYDEMNFRTPWKLIASAATVIGGRFILSADYEWEPMHTMKFSQPTNYGYGDDWGPDWDDDWGPDWGDDWGYWEAPRGKAPQKGPYSKSVFDDIHAEANANIRKYYKSTNTLRVGAEYRVTPQFSIRAGYSFVSSPVNSEVKNNREVVSTAGTMPNYTLDNTTNYITAGLGYRYKKFYVDLAYVYKHLSTEYHAYTPDPENPQIPSPQAKVGLSNNQIVLSAGFRF